MKVRLGGIRLVTEIRGRQRQEAGTQRRKEIGSAAVVVVVVEVEACSSQLQKVTLGAATRSWTYGRHGERHHDWAKTQIQKETWRTMRPCSCSPLKR